MPPVKLDSSQPVSITSMTTTLRIPRGLWNDLEESVIKQDRIFLAEVARALGLPFQEVMRKVGPATTVMPTLWVGDASDPTRCPWYTRRGESVWFPCQRLRLSPTMPCCVHERQGPCDSLVNKLEQKPKAFPVVRKGVLYWVTEDGTAYDEAGSEITNGLFRFMTFREKKIALWVPSLEE